MTESQQIYYNPQIKVLIDTNNNGIVDVSEDIVSFQLDRIINGLSTFTCILQNKKRKYTMSGNNIAPVIETMNRIVVSMSRVQMIQVFSGYVTQAPIITILPNAIEIVAKCTLKRIQNTYWDSSVPELRGIIPGAASNNNSYPANEYTDGGAAKGMTRLLVDVVGWDPKQIYIDKIPERFLNFTSREFNNLNSELDSTLAAQLKAAIDADGVVGMGSSTSSGTGVNSKISTTNNTNYNWAQAVLAECGFPITENNLNNFTCWMQEENGSTWWNPGLNNPLNININEQYNNLADAARATANNITGIGVQIAYYLNDIVPALKNDVSYDQFVAALRKSIWDREHYPNPFPKPKIPVYAVPGDPQIFDDVAAAAVAAAKTQIGVNYVYGTESPGKSFDCSGLTQWAYQRANVSLPHYSGAQFAQGPQLDAKNTIPQPGDLIFYGALGGEHVIMCTVSPDDLTGKNGKVIQSPETGKKVFEGPMDGYQTDNGGITGLTRPWATTINPNVSGKSGQNINNTSGSSSQSSTTSAFNIAFILPQYNPVAIQTYGSPRGFIMDEPVLNSVSQLANASFRSFQSLGTGEFMAWFPDYFGIWGTNAVYQVYEAEITDLAINHSDDPLSTHVAVAGDTTLIGGGQSITTQDWLSTVGIVSVQTPNFMQMLFGDQYPTTFDSEKFLNKYGMRPYISSQPIIRDHLLEFASSANTFMNLWAEQYRTEIGFTFMPEVYPGMRLQFPEIIVQGGCLEVYVQSVVHQGSMSSGFTTRLEITAPVAANPVSGNKSILYLGLD